MDVINVDILELNHYDSVNWTLTQIARFRLTENIMGGVAEWLKAADCKSARIAYVGSNPAPTTKSHVMIE